MMARNSDGELEEQSIKGYQEAAFEAFMCPLTKQVMQEPVTIETGQTFEREAILKWFRECSDNGRRPTCPLTQRELRTTDINPSIALRNVIDEWRARNDKKDLEKACNALRLHPQDDEDDSLRAMAYISQICQRSGAKKNLVRAQGIISTLADLLKSSSRRVRLKTLQVLRTVVEDNDLFFPSWMDGWIFRSWSRVYDIQEELGKGDTVRTIIKFLSNEHIQERELAVSLLYELSEYEPVCERIGAVYGAIFLLVGMGSSKSENMMAVEKAEKTLKNLEKYDTNIKQMAENGRLQPLLTKLLQGGPEVQVTMVEYLGELALANDVKVVVAEHVGTLLVSIIKTGGLPVREATLMAMREMSSNELSAKILLQAGILPPLVKDLFSVGASSHFPMRLKEVSATILANLVASGASFRSIPLDDAGRQTLLSEDVVHSLLHLISNTGPAVECKLLNVLVDLTSSPDTAQDVVSAIKSSGATFSLIQFLEAAHREIRVESLKLLRNVSPYMGAELADALGGHLSSLLRVISDAGGGGVTEEQAAAVGLLGDLPERDSKLTRQLFELGAFGTLSTKLAELRRGAIRGNRYSTPLTVGMVKVMYRLTCMLQEAPEYVETLLARTWCMQSLPTPTKSGPRGGSGGTARDIKEDPWRLHSLTISYQGLIDAFSFSYIDQSGKKQRVGPWGEECSYHKTETIRFSPSEFVEEVCGAYGSHGENILVTSLTFVTNIRTYGPFGNSHHQNVAATPFRFMADEGSSIVAFHGRSGSHLFSIGVYMYPSNKTTVRALSAPVILKGQAGSSPHPISLQHLKDITDNFSEDRILGSGGFGVVYKGVLHGEIVAVKKLAQSTPKSHKQFKNEVDLLMTLEHPNIVRLVGYCYDTQELLMPFEGKMVVAHSTECLLCLECMPNGSLDKYISDVSSGLDWHKRCKIIEGISFGLQYLHEQANDPIIHLDLKPANILLGENLVPKITDFGLSRLFDKKTMHTTVASGTLGYMALEYQQRGIITPMADIFSLGVIILEVITGHRDYPYDIRTHSEEFIKLELQKWRNRLHKEPVYTSLEIHCQQIERYIQIGLICVNTEREKRPTMNKIIDMLQGLESMDWYIRNELSSQNIMEEQ